MLSMPFIRLPLRQAAKLALLTPLLALAACQDPYDPTLHADYAIRVAPVVSADHKVIGSVALPPACPSWADEIPDPYDEQPYPQFGCSNAQNLAAMIERPDDLIAGRPLSDARSAALAAGVQAYDTGPTAAGAAPAAAPAASPVVTQ